MNGEKRYLILHVKDFNMINIARILQLNEFTMHILETFSSFFKYQTFLVGIRNTVL